MDPYDNAAGELGAVRPTAATQSSNPYAAPGAAVREIGAEGSVELASRLARLGAVLIDSALFMVPAIILAVAVPEFAQYASGGSSGSLGAGASITMMVLGLAMLALAIYQFVLLYRNGQTIGKKIVGVRIVRPDGSRVTFPRLLFLRYVLPGVISAIPFLGLVFYVIDSLFIFADDRRTLHDKIADTIVVNA